MKRAVFGVIGHVDHGKTALVRALTGTDTDRLPEEKRRGISIVLGFAHFSVGETTVDLIDMPGHERFVRTMVSGATGIGAALLVVAANEGVKQQTVEHVEIAALLGVRRAVVAIGKCDLVDPAAVQDVAASVATLLRRVGLSADPAIAVSVRDGTGIEALRAALLAEKEVPPDDTGLPFLPIDRAFSVAGHGTVVTGTLRGGAVAPGDTLALWPGERPLRVRGVQVHGARVPRAAPGQRVALNLRDVEAAEVKPGAMLAAPGALTESRWLSVTLRAVDDAPKLANAARLRALLGTSEVDIRLRLLNRDTLEPGASCLAQLHCNAPLAVPAREKLILRLASPAQTVAGGIVIEPDTTRRRRHDASVLTRLEQLARLPPVEIVMTAPAGTSVPQLARLSGLPPARVTALLASGGAVAKAPARRVESDPDRIRAEAELCGELAEALRQGGLSPPDLGTLADRKRALDRLVRAGIVVRAPDPAQKRVVLFHREAIDDARRRLQPLLAQPPGMLVSEVGAALGISRKYSVPLLEYLDQVRFTRRVQDRRILMV